MTKWMFAVLLFAFSSLFANEPSLPTVERGFIEDAEHRKIEFFFLKPNGEGPFPTIFLLHGFQPLENSEGGKQYVTMGYLKSFANKGVLAVAISSPGFGGSEGQRDRGGPNSQNAVAFVMRHFEGLPFVDANRMALYGVSQGADLAGMVSAQFPELCCMILESGLYDLVTIPPKMPDYLQGIKNSIAILAGERDEGLICRSAVYYADKIQASTLLLHGEFDDRRGALGAKKLHEKLIDEGKESRLMIFPNQIHVLNADKWDAIVPFLREKFFNLVGIGLNISDPFPAIQITKIQSGSPAELCGKLNIGDAILRISPENDELELDVTKMSKVQLVNHILGKKGTRLRLYVQHFDLSFESIVLERNSY